MAAMTTVFRDICRKCLYEDPSQYELVTFKCFRSDRHRGEQKMAVCWNPQSRELEPMLYHPRDDSAERESRIRPMPTDPVTRSRSMGGVDLNDQYQSYYPSGRSDQPQPLMHPIQPVYQAAAVNGPYGYPVMVPSSQFMQPSTVMSPGPGQYSVDWPELSSSTRQPVRHPRQPVHHPSQPVHHPPQPVHHPPPKVATTAAIATGEQCKYAAKCSIFMERVKEDLDIADIQQELTRENYKEKFHKLLCWEEKEHIDILERRCSGHYTLVLYRTGFKPQWITVQPDQERFGYLQGLDGDKIAYATQASEAAIIIIEQGIEIAADILPENFRHTDEKLYIAFNDTSERALRQALAVTNQPYENQVEVEFELKHSYFDNLHRAIEGLYPEVIAKLVPEPTDFKPDIAIQRIPFPKYPNLKLDDDFPGDQFKALRVAAFTHCDAPPVLIAGPFGAGKTRLLATATYFFLQEGKRNQQVTRILVCAHHQASADTFLECYFGLMVTDDDHPWRVNLTRLTSKDYHHRSGKYSQWCQTLFEFKRKTLYYAKQKWLLIITTFLTSLHLREVFSPGFFTHILMDEGAQAREPEAVASFCLATNDTKIVIAGDPAQVGPSLLVLGEEARDNGLNQSLLERLQNLYKKTPHMSSHCCASLLTNYRCHKEIVHFSSNLFYEESLQCQVPDWVTHPVAPFPLLFVCSSVDENVQLINDNKNEHEARIVLEQVAKFVRNWPVEWDEKDLNKMCIVTNTRSQITVMRKLAPKYLKGIRMLPSYDIQGQEFLAVFLSTSEPTFENGSTRNPTKSMCDPYVFNTVITRAKSLVLGVGNPFLLLKTEKYMVELYGRRGKCWSEFLKSCLKHGTVDLPTLTNKDVQQNIKEKLKNLVKQPVKNAKLVESNSVQKEQPSRASALSLTPTNETLSQPHQSISKEIMPQLAEAHHKKATSSNKQKDFPLPTQPGGSKPSQKPVSLVQMQKPVNTGSSVGVSKSSQKLGTANQSLAKTGLSRTSQKANAPLQLQSPAKTNGSLRLGISARLPKFIPDPDDFPSLSEAAQIPQKKKTLQTPLTTQHLQPPSQEHCTDIKTKKKHFDFYPKWQPTDVPAQRQHTDFYKEHQNKLDKAVIEKKLTRSNYKEKFHHLLCWEEREHERVLTCRCDGKYTIKIFLPGFVPEKLDDEREEHVRYGLISGSDGDAMAYAKQASEGAIIALPSGSLLHVRQVFAYVPRGEDATSITIALTQPELNNLLQWNRKSKTQCVFEANVQFKLKHSYFQRLHQAVTKVTPEIIAKIMPEKDDFREYDVVPQGKPKFEQLELDYTGQMQALNAIISSHSTAPILVVGPFGTGKTRLLARAAYQILKHGRSKARVLVCAHHQASVDTFLNYFGQMRENKDKPWHVGLVRIIPNSNYRSSIRQNYSDLFKTAKEIHSLKVDNFHLVITTLGTAFNLHQKFRNRFFTHILMDEGAQTREPESVGPLCLANKETKIVIAGDHNQVGPRLLVLGSEAQQNGLGTSLLERLHKHYETLGGVSQQHSISLLTNYRCHSGILTLPSSLFYGSTLQCRVPEESAHPDAPYPLVFVCSSLDASVQWIKNDTNEAEARLLLQQVSKFVKNWPRAWGKVDQSQICIMTPSANQKALILRKMWSEELSKNVKGVEVLKAYEIQGREFRAIFIGTSEVTTDKCEALNPTKSICDRYVFNTAITRAQSLVVSVGNPFVLVKMEQHMKDKYGEGGKCWSEYIRRCLECKTFYHPPLVQHDLKGFQHAKQLLYEMIFSNIPQAILPTVEDTQGNSDAGGDSILTAYKKQFENIPECKQTKLTLSHIGKDLTWNLKEAEDKQESPEITPEVDVSGIRFVETYKCQLSIKHYRKAEAIPLDHTKKVVKIGGVGNRRGAFDGDVVEVGIFPKNPEGKCYGRVIRVIDGADSRRFVCTVYHKNSTLFCPIDKKEPLICNLPRLSRDLLKGPRYKRSAINEDLKSTDVVVFDPKSVSLKGRHLPQIRSVIPLAVAQNMVFVVQFLLWKPKYRFPLGIVIDALPKGISFFDGERLLMACHGIEYNDSIQSEPSVATDHQQDPCLFPLYDRAFTIDPVNAINLDDAVSLKLLDHMDETVRYELAVHIVNAAKHISGGSIEDRKARDLGTSVYAGAEGKTMHMLPAHVRIQLSLNPKCTRDVLSTVAVVSVDNNTDTITLEKVKMMQAQVKSCMKLSYKTAQQIMENQHLQECSKAINEFDAIDGQPTLAETLQLLYKIALKMRQERLRSSAAYCYEVEESEERSCWQTHMMIEELMIWANSVVANQIYDIFKDVALVRRQGAPNCEELAAVTGEHSLVMGHSLYLEQFVPHALPSVPFIVPLHTVKEIVQAIKSGNVALLVNLLTSNHYYPQLAATHAQLRSLQQPAEYCCTSSKEDKSFYRHHSLNLDIYTHFTSPMRRYLDIQVQRMLTAIHEKPTSYETQFQTSFHQRLCQLLNAKAKNAKQFEKKMKCLSLAQKYTFSSEIHNAFIVSVSKGRVELSFPNLEMKTLHFNDKSFNIKHLGSLGKLNDDLQADENSRTCQTWKIKMTSFENPGFIFETTEFLHFQQTKAENKPTSSGKVAGLRSTEQTYTRKDLITSDSETSIKFEVALPDESSNSRLKIVHYNATATPSVVKLEPTDWRKALEFACNPTTEGMEVLKNIFHMPPCVASGPKIEQNDCSFVVYHLTRSIAAYDTIKVWMTYSNREAILSPKLQLLELAPKVHICLEHNSHPAECFSDPILESASRKFYNNIQEYVQLWEKVLLAEGSERSVKEGQPVIIHDVTLKWPRLGVPPNCIDETYYEPQGNIVLELPSKFQKENSEFFRIRVGDMICARYGTDPHSETRAVFHMVVSAVPQAEEMTESDQTLEVQMKFIGKQNCRVSEKMKCILESGSAKCEVQLVTMSTSYQRVYRGLIKLTPKPGGYGAKFNDAVSRLAREVAEGDTDQEVRMKRCYILSNVENGIEACNILQHDSLATTLWCSNKKLNRVQMKAVQLALTKRFQLIQGPPGTGKSETGAHIAYVLAMLNRRIGGGKSVLYCGPSNKAVDVVLHNLHNLTKIDSSLKILRIYGRAVERQQYPGPYRYKHAYQREQSEYKCPDWAMEYSLHHIIHQADRHPDFRNVVELEQKFERDLSMNYIATSVACRDHRAAIWQAEKRVLSQHYDIVLCTCNEASSKRVSGRMRKDGTVDKLMSPRQCIIDESGMAYEPETMVPISLCEHAVLLGDHKQLQPIVEYHPAREHGLTTSLFQRYAQSEGFCKTLTVQYRMHEEICAFPSEHFYERKLETDVSVKKRTNAETCLQGFWPRGPKFPILFCDFVGKEGEYKAGSKGEKQIGIDSKFNYEEAEKVIQLARVLHWGHNVRLKEIAILTPYSAQKEIIKQLAVKAKLLNEKGGEVGAEIKVATITESQGDEYGIVLLSTVRSQPMAEIANPEHVQPDRGWLLENLGFLTDEHQVNVGITRSKYGLIIVGNRRLLNYDITWEALLDHYEEKECIVSAHSFPSKVVLKKLPPV